VSPVFGKSVTVTHTNENGTGSLPDTIATASNGSTINFNVSVPETIMVLNPLTLRLSMNVAGPGGVVLTIMGNSAVVFIINTGAKLRASEKSVSLAAESRPSVGTLVAVVKGEVRSHNVALRT